MEVSEALPCYYHHLITPRNLSSFLFNSERFLSPYMCHHFPLGNMVRFTLCVGGHISTMNPVMSARKGHSTRTCEGLCNIVWTIEANLEAGQLLYITGDMAVLGCWQPEMAVLMRPTEDERLWKADVKIPYGINFKYNYFITEETQSSSDIIWRSGPEFSLSVPSTVNRSRKIVVRDSWMKVDMENSLAHIWGSWIEETQLVKPLISSHAQDESGMAKDLAIDPKKQGQRQNVAEVQSIQNNLAVNDESAFHGRDQPIEEPWLLQSSISENEMQTGLVSEIEIMEDYISVYNQHSPAEDKLLPAEECNQILKDDAVSTIILINSSICTMQRIAVLEDEKLVELLLEPVKSDVQCDSVYIGVVTKLVPHMGGAFVNIGSSRPSFMDIKHNREPFIFPPFRQKTRKREVNGCSIEALVEHPLSEENEKSLDVHVTDDVGYFVSQDESATMLFDDNDDDFDILDVKENINGSMIDYEKLDNNVEHFSNGNGYDLEGVKNDALPVETDKSTASLVPNPQIVEDPKHRLVHESNWTLVRKGTKIIVQVVKEGLGTKGPTLTAHPKLKSRFWILLTRCDKIGVSKKIAGIERTRLKVIAKTLQPPGFGLTVRTVAAGHSLEELQKDLEGLLFTWKTIVEHAKSAALAADEGIEGAVPLILHSAMGQTLSVVQDYFNEKVKKMVVDSPRTYHEVTNYLQEIAPDLCGRVELYDKRNTLFGEFNIEEEIDNILSKRVPLNSGGSLVIEQTEALVSIDVNGGHVMFGQGTSQEKAVLDVNLAAAKQIARELRLRDIGGIIVVDFIDMTDDSNKRLVYEEMKRAVERDRSTVKVSELSKHGLMEITRKRVRPSVTFMISEPCPCCHATGRIEALETSFSKIEQEICRLLAARDQEADPENPKTWPRFILRVDHHMCNYLTSGKRTRLAILSSSLKVWILLKVARGFTRGEYEVQQFTDDKESKIQHQAAISILRKAETSTTEALKKFTLLPVRKGKASGK